MALALVALLERRRIMRTRSSITRIGALVLNGFVALTAIAGGIWVVPTMPLDWIKAGPFTDWTIPAIALTAVGVAAAVALISVLVRPWLGALATVAVGAAMVTFELVEIAVVGWTLSDPGPTYFQSWLQLVYLVVGSAQVLVGARMWAATRASAPSIWLVHPAAGSA
jgi:hypothetical protein